ncbi:MAG: hypothetical protein GY696_05370 [Gammaproteobacteria bacterium]|nr:hypothetical protein [Gammaproteobacteria bacterium]
MSAKTYIWRYNASNCHHHRVRTIAPNPTQSLQKTQLKNIYLADLAMSDNREKVYKMPQISIREIDIQRNTAVTLEYVAYQLSRQIEAATQTAGARVCKQQHETWDSTPVQIRPGLFSLAAQIRQVRS